MTEPLQPPSPGSSPPSPSPPPGWQPIPLPVSVPRPASGGNAASPGDLSASSTADSPGRPLWQGVVAGVVLAGVVVAVLVAVGAMHFGSVDSSKAKVDTKAIVLPNGLGGFQDTVAASRAKGGSPANIAKLKARLDKVASLTADAYEQAYGGAAAAVRAYSDASLEHSATVIAVRASAPGLTDGVVQDAESLGLAVPYEAIGQFGDVSCTVHRQTTVPAGQTVDPNDAIYTFCERTGPGLTVVGTGSGFNGESGRKQITGLVDAAFDAVSKS